MTKLPDGISFLQFNQEKLGKIWEELRDYCWYLGEGEFSDPVYFTKVFTASNSVIFETSYGYMVAEDIRPGKSCKAHLPFTDHKLSTHTEDVKKMLTWAIIEFDLQRIETYVYSFQNAVKRFLTGKLGFTKEGTLRRKAFLRDKWRDVEIYSILREEVFDGMV